MSEKEFEAELRRLTLEALLGLVLLVLVGFFLYRVTSPTQQESLVIPKQFHYGQPVLLTGFYAACTGRVLEQLTHDTYRVSMHCRSNSEYPAYVEHEVSTRDLVGVPE